jgi:hypothetical protein
MRKSPSRFWLPVTLLLLIAANASSAAQQYACGKTPLIEVSYDAFGMLAPQGKYLYVRVCEDGRLQYEIEGTSPGVKEMRTGRLTDSQLSSLHGLFDTAEIRALHGTYGSESKFRDYRLTVAVRVRRPDHVQTFAVLSLLSNAQPTFPPSVLTFFCAMDKLRETDFKMSRDCSQ